MVRSDYDCSVLYLIADLRFAAGKLTSYFANKAAAAAAARALAPPPSIPIPELGPDFRQVMELTRLGSNARRHIAKRSLQGRGLSAEQELLP